MCIEGELPACVADQDVIAVNAHVLAVLLFDLAKICGIIGVGEAVEDRLHNAAAGGENGCAADDGRFQRFMEAAHVKSKFTVSAPPVRIDRGVGVRYKEGPAHGKGVAVRGLVWDNCDFCFQDLFAALCFHRFIPDFIAGSVPRKACQDQARGLWFVNEVQVEEKKSLCIMCSSRTTE